MPEIRIDDVLVVRAVDERHVRAGDIVMFRLEGQEFCIVHRVVKIYEYCLIGEVELFTKDDDNLYDNLKIFKFDR